MEIRLVVIAGKQAGMEILVRRPKFLIGRGEDCQIRPQNHLVSRKHCGILIEKDGVAIEDYGSTNGTFVNGEKIQQRRVLNSGDRIRIGSLELEARWATGAADAKKPKVHSVQEAAARTVASAAVANDDAEISKWLAEDDAEEPAAPLPAKKPGPQPGFVPVHDTVAGKPIDDTTTTMPAEPGPKKKEKKPVVKATGQFKQPAKPVAESSHSAAENMLRQFFPGKKR
jgi:predicted component of type VI protein secretion system